MKKLLCHDTGKTLAVVKWLSENASQSLITPRDLKALPEHVITKLEQSEEGTVATFYSVEAERTRLEEALASLEGLETPRDKTEWKLEQSMNDDFEMVFQIKDENGEVVEEHENPKDAQFAYSVHLGLKKPKAKSVEKVEAVVEEPKEVTEAIEEIIDTPVTEDVKEVEAVEETAEPTLEQPKEVNAEAVEEATSTESSNTEVASAEMLHEVGIGTPEETAAAETVEPTKEVADTMADPLAEIIGVFQNSNDEESTESDGPDMSWLTNL